MNHATRNPCKALLIIDLQLAMFESDRIPPIDAGDALLKTAQSLLARAREARVPVVYVRHDGGAGHVLEAGTSGWQIHRAIAPRPGEVVIDKRTPDAFHQTSLQAELSRLGIAKLIVAGAQTEVCIDTTCRRASSLGFDATLVSDGHSTWDNDILTAAQIVRHHNRLLARTFVKLQTAAEIDFKAGSAAEPTAAV
jgi:nicotinamidase-related amidase